MKIDKDLLMIYLENFKGRLSELNTDGSMESAIDTLCLVIGAVDKLAEMEVDNDVS